MGTDFFATGLQKKTEKIGEDFLRLSISKHSDFYGAVWITQNAPFFTGICGRTESSAPTRKREGASESAEGSQGKIRVVAVWFFDGGAAGDAAEGVVAEAAAAVVAGDDAAELADHRLIVNFARELAIGAVAVDLLSEQHGAAASLFFRICPHYTRFPRKLLWYFLRKSSRLTEHSSKDAAPAVSGPCAPENAAAGQLSACSSGAAMSVSVQESAA